MNIDWLNWEWIVANKWLLSLVVLLVIGIAWKIMSDDDDAPYFKDEQNKHLFKKEFNRLIYGAVAGTSLLFLFEIGEPPLSFVRLMSLYCFIISLFASAILFLIFTITTTVREETNCDFRIEKAGNNKFEKYLIELFLSAFILAFVVCFQIGIAAWLWDFNEFASYLSLCLFNVGIFYYSFVLKITNRFKKEYQETK